MWCSDVKSTPRKPLVVDRPRNMQAVLIRSCPAAARPNPSLDERPQAARLQSATVPDPKVWLSAARMSRSAPVRYTICDRSGNKQIRGFRCAHSFPRPSDVRATPGNGCKADRIVSGMTTRSDRSVRRTEKIVSAAVLSKETGLPKAERGGANATRTSNGVRRETSTRGNSPLHRQELQVGEPHTEGGKGQAMALKK